MTDLVLEEFLHLDGPWTFPEVIKGLPLEANELRLPDQGAPTMNYVRGDVVDKLRDKIRHLEQTLEFMEYDAAEFKAKYS
jgi:hypothetical protein